MLSIALLLPFSFDPSFTPQLVDPFFMGASAVTTADLDGDGRLDLVAAGYYDDNFSWWRNLGGGGWEQHEVFAINGAFSIKAADLDGDGDTDLYGSSITNSDFGEDTAWWFENTLGEGPGPLPSFEPRLLVEFPNEDPHSMDAADFDGDGNLDLAVAFVYESLLHIYLNPTGQGPGGAPLIVVAPDVNGCSVVRGDDFDGDGDVDLIAATPWDWIGPNNVYWFENLGGATFGPRNTIGGGLDLGGLFAIEVGDLNGDGLKDVVASSEGSYGNPTVQWFERLDAAGQSWAAPQVIDAAFYGADGDQSIELIDLDADGDLDLVGGSSFLDPRVRVWLNNGQGRFRKLDVEPGFNAHGVTAADVDGDGHLELIGASWGQCCYSGEIVVWDVTL